MSVVGNRLIQEGNAFHVIGCLIDSQNSRFVRDCVVVVRITRKACHSVINACVRAFVIGVRNAYARRQFACDFYLEFLSVVGNRFIFKRNTVHIIGCFVDYERIRKLVRRSVCPLIVGFVFQFYFNGIRACIRCGSSGNRVKLARLQRVGLFLTVISKYRAICNRFIYVYFFNRQNSRFVRDCVVVNVTRKACHSVINACVRTLVVGIRNAYARRQFACDFYHEFLSVVGNRFIYERNTVHIVGCLTDYKRIRKVVRRSVCPLIVGFVFKRNANGIVPRVDSRRAGNVIKLARLQRVGLFLTVISKYRAIRSRFRYACFLNRVIHVHRAAFKRAFTRNG